MSGFAAPAAAPSVTSRTRTVKQHTVIDSPYGPLTLVATDGSLSGLYMVAQRHRPPEEHFGTRDDTPFGETTDQLEAYFAGELKEFDLPLSLAGTPFQRTVWAQLQKIPYGETRSYGELADALGNPKASRAVGLANGKNPVGIIVPCHRVVGADGSLTGYGGGLDRKQRLLDFERGAALF
jgi:methylated-DNA-[protein]-cysteine S-methyltransferase